MPYNHFSRFYDLVMGDRSRAARFTCSLIARHKPKTNTVLEIACGTGAILGFLSDRYDVTGLDRSRPMLAIARQKLPHIQFIHRDMTSFHIAKRFDAIVCVFDSLNHLLRFGEWQQTFRQVARHLEPDGIFVFDVNTSGKLQRLADGPAWTGQFERDIVIIKVTGDARRLFTWDVKIFEHETKRRYRLHHEMIQEIAPPYKQVVVWLRKRFKQVKVIDPEGSRVSDQSERLFFVCRK
jgi:SAM-dependent methyltransferase